MGAWIWRRKKNDKNYDLQKEWEWSDAIPENPETSVNYTLVGEADPAFNEGVRYGYVSVSGFPVQQIDAAFLQGERFFVFTGLWCKAESIVVSKTSDFGSYPNGPANGLLV